jgi:two-component system response regulator RegA
VNGIYHSSILIVDDDEALCEALSRAFARRGFRTTVAHDADAAILAARNERPDHAVVDLRLPDQSGLKVLARLLDLHPPMKVVILTGHGSIPTAIAAIRLGAAHYLTKPVDTEAILAAFDHAAGDDDTPVNDKPMSPSRLEWEHINRILLEHKGNISATARALSLHRRTLQRKLAKHALRS